MTNCDEQINITNLKKKYAIVAAINFATFAFDMAMTYHLSSLQVNRQNNSNFYLYKNQEIRSILNAIEPSCYALSAFADNMFLTKNDGFVDTVDTNGNLTSTNNDVSDFTGNAHFLLLHLTKTAVRIAKYANMKQA